MSYPQAYLWHLPPVDGQSPDMELYLFKPEDITTYAMSWSSIEEFDMASATEMGYCEKGVLNVSIVKIWQGGRAFLDIPVPSRSRLHHQACRLGDKPCHRGGGLAC